MAHPESSTSTGSTLAEKLRFIDILFECSNKARAQLVAEGKVYAHKPYMCEFEHPDVRRQQALQLKRAAKLVAKTVINEAINPAVITQPSIRAAYDALTAKVAA